MSTARKILLAIGILVGGFVLLSILCAGCASIFAHADTDTNEPGNTYTYTPTTTGADQSQFTPTPVPTATPKPARELKGYELYKDWDEEKIKAEAISVSMDDLMRNTDNYKDKLITIKAHVVLSSEISGGYEYTMDINPNLMLGEIGDHGNNYSPQFIAFQYGTKFLDGDVVQIYGVYTGDETWTGYPIIKGVYAILYTE